jgi:hypothetical protein
VAYLRVRQAGHAGAAEHAVGEERVEFKKREAVLGQHEERVAQQLVGAGAERVQSPAVLKDLSELGDPEEAVFASGNVERVEAHGEIGIRRIDYDYLVAEVCAHVTFFSGNQGQQRGR